MAHFEKKTKKTASYLPEKKEGKILPMRGYKSYKGFFLRI